jgi:hypothetical protein
MVKSRPANLALMGIGDNRMGRVIAQIGEVLARFRSQLAPFFLLGLRC